MFDGPLAPNELARNEDTVNAVRPEDVFSKKVRPEREECIFCELVRMTETRPAELDERLLDVRHHPKFNIEYL